ncbi:hypothetical protein [Nocardioides nematodiphilus]|uniref:hypothetical protein n=1 Tax=Nocardioides nematodiphilus TaxID=2849669 RepID=UPI001CD9DB2E|nr:hypothetical protein [Nocardioides nematodiphilus]MCA1984101.1 hypothetical protein [Nocardioides nematodiphilus]
MNTLLRRTSALAAAALAAGALTLPAGTAQAATAQPAGLRDAISWLHGNLGQTGLLPGFDGTTPSISATADFAKGLSEVGSPELSTVAGSITTAAAAALGDDHRSAQETAEGAWASTLGGAANAQLTSDLEAHIAQGGETVQVATTTYGPGPDYTPTTTVTPTTSAPAAKGRLLDQTFSEWTGTDAQSWAVEALGATGSASLGDALGYLLHQQCADGGFRSKFDAVDAATQDCVGATGSTEQTASSPDATASAVIALSTLATPSTAVTTAIGKAATWLSTHQKADGSYSEPSSYGDYTSTNSAGLAARALLVSGHASAAAPTVALLRSLQIAPIAGCASGLAADRGAVLYASDNYDAALASGIGTGQKLGSALSVTSQSLGALTALPAATALKISQTPAAVKPGAKATLSLAGVAAGERVCVTGAGAARLLAPGTTSFTVTAPAKGAAASVTASTASGTTATAALKIDTATTLKVAAPKKAHRGQRITVRIKGLWAGEKVTLKLAKAKLGKATANANGTAVFKGRVAKRNAPGKKKLVATGAFADRTGATALKVVR